MADDSAVRDSVVRFLCGNAREARTRLEIQSGMGCRGVGNAQVNRVLYVLMGEGVVSRTDTRPPRWRVTAGLELAKQEADDEGTRVLVVVDLGNVHDCFAGWRDSPGYEIWGFADAGYNMASVMNGQEYDASNEQWYRCWTHIASKRRLWQCVDNRSDACDLLMMHTLSTALETGSITHGCAVIVLSKDKIFATYAAMMTALGYAVQNITSTVDLDALL